MNRIKKISISSALLFLLIVLYSCREEIVDPTKSVGTVNQPVSLNYYNSYTFLIDAQDISFVQTDLTNITYNKSKITFSIKNYSSGYVGIKIISENKSVIFYKYLGYNVSDTTVFFTFVIPEKIQLNFDHFTGKLKLNLSSL